MDERIQRVAEGDANALAELLYAHHDALSQFVCRKIPRNLRATMDGDDLLQEVFTRAFAGMANFQPSSDRALYRWLETIALNLLRDRIAAEKTKKRGGDLQRVDGSPRDKNESYNRLANEVSSGLTSPSRQVARLDVVMAIKIHVAALPDDQREAVVLRHIEGLDREEVARRMNCTVDRVRGLLLRARKKLRVSMGNTSKYFSKD